MGYTLPMMIRDMRRAIAGGLFSLMLLAGAAQACPNCREAFSPDANTSDPAVAQQQASSARLGRAWSTIIMVMAPMPIVIAASAGTVLYLQTQKHQKLLAARAAAQQTSSK